MTADATSGVCPVRPYTFAEPAAEALSSFAGFDAMRAGARPFFRSDEAGGYWVFTDSQVILEGLQDYGLFSSAAMVPTEPDPPYKWIPIMLDPPDHTKWRQLLAGWFSPGRVRQMADDQRRFAADLVDGVAARGECDFVPDIAQIFPTTIFLRIMGMPVEDLDQFMIWEHAILHPTGDAEASTQAAMDGMMAVMGYFAQLVAERRAHPDPAAQDLVSAAVNWQVDGQRATDNDLLSCFLLLFMAGLDTVASQSSYGMLDLATHPATARRLVADPTRIPDFVEEMLRAYPIVQTARKVTRDADFHGCPVKAGDMAVFPLSAAGRDATLYDNPGQVDLDRGVTRHFSFGAGPHRCLGSHLARQEMVVLLEEWHRRIPVYELAGPATEHTGGVYGIDSLPLRWPV